MEINTKDNLKMTKGMAKVFSTLQINHGKEINTMDNIKITK